MNESRDSGPEHNAATMLALLGLTVLGAGLLLLAALVIPQVLGILLVVGGLFFFCVLHYMVWGRWMSNTPDEDDDEN